MRLTLPRFTLEPGTSIVVQVADHATRPVYASRPLRVTLHDPSHHPRLSSTGKAMRALDLFGVLLLLPLIVTSFLVVPPLIWAHGERALFRQTRIGFRQRRFTLYKFHTLRDDQKIGRRLSPFLRHSGIDEAPQLLFHVLRGQMSLFGSRPPQPGELGPEAEAALLTPRSSVARARSSRRSAHRDRSSHSSLLTVRR